MEIDPRLRDGFIVEEDKLIVFDDFGDYLCAGSFDDELFIYEDGMKEKLDNFKEAFEIVNMGRNIMGDPNESFYQGVNFVKLVRRKSDGKLFGFDYFRMLSDISNETGIEPNGDEHGYDFEVPNDFNWEEDYYPSVYVWLPVKTFTITGYTTRAD